MVQTVNGQHAQALVTAQEAHIRGCVLTQSTYMLLMVACCVDAKFDSLLEVLSMMANHGAQFNVYTAKDVVRACAAHDSTILKELLITLQGIAPLTTQCCALAIAAALELKDIDTALKLFDTMKKHGIERDELIYAAIAAECYRHRYYDCMHVLDEAKAVGLMPELAEGDSSAKKLLRAVESVVQPNFEVVQSLVWVWIREDSSTFDLTLPGRVPQRLKSSGWDKAHMHAVAAVRLLLQEVAEHKAGDTWFIARAALMITNYWIFDGPFTDTLKIKFRTGSPCGDQLARELRVQLQSGAISVSTDADEGTTTYSIHVPGLSVYCADCKRKTLLEVITKQTQQQQAHTTTAADTASSYDILPCKCYTTMYSMYVQGNRLSSVFYTVLSCLLSQERVPDALHNTALACMLGVETW
eukprot:13245-Heterococcus_DN1.PRE.4